MMTWLTPIKISLLAVGINTFAINCQLLHPLILPASITSGGIPLSPSNVSRTIGGGGEMLVVMGLSGSGKSTLLNLIGGLDSPTSGEVVINGEHLEKMGASALSDWRASNVGFIFQFYNLLPVLTANKNVVIASLS